MAGLANGAEGWSGVRMSDDDESGPRGRTFVRTEGAASVAWGVAAVVLSEIFEVPNQSASESESEPVVEKSSSPSSGRKENAFRGLTVDSGDAGS